MDAQTIQMLKELLANVKKGSIPEDNFAYSIFLSIDGGKSEGSGFRIKYKDKNYIITAKHVLYKDDRTLWGKILLVTCQSPILGEEKPTKFQVLLEDAKIFPSNTDDVAAILIGKNEKQYMDDTPLKDLTHEGKRPTHLVPEEYIIPIEVGLRAVSVDMEATRTITEIKLANDVYLMGYPISLGLQKNDFFDYSKPLIRKGIIAGINLKENTFVIDCPAYPGNSGGPVVEDCEDGYFRVIGLVSRYIPYEIKWFSNRDKISNTELANSGYSVCVPINAVSKLLDSIKE